MPYGEGISFISLVDSGVISTGGEVMPFPSGCLQTVIMWLCILKKSLVDPLDLHCHIHILIHLPQIHLYNNGTEQFGVWYLAGTHTHSWGDGEWDQHTYLPNSHTILFLLLSLETDWNMKWWVGDYRLLLLCLDHTQFLKLHSFHKEVLGAVC